MTRFFVIRSLRPLGPGIAMLADVDDARFAAELPGGDLFG